MATFLRGLWSRPPPPKHCKDCKARLPGCACEADAATPARTPDSVGFSDDGTPVPPCDEWPPEARRSDESDPLDDLWKRYLGRAELLPRRWSELC